MDPASVGGLAMGVASLALDVFDRSVKREFFQRQSREDSLTSAQFSDSSRRWLICPENVNGVDFSL